MGEGDTGAPKPQGSLAESDVFTKREAAEEAMYVKKKEMERLSGLKAKLKERKEQEESDKSVEEQIKNQRGVHN